MMCTYYLSNSLIAAARESYAIEERGSRKGRHPYCRANRKMRTHLAAVYLSYRQWLIDEMVEHDPDNLFT